MKFNGIVKKVKTNFVPLCKKFWAKTVEYVKIAKIELIVLVAVLFVDLLTKYIVEATMSVGETIVLIPNLLNCTYTINIYAAMGSFFGLEDYIGEEAVRVILLIVTFIATIGFFVAMYKFRNDHILARLTFALIISGALGNFYDRLFLSGVRDFIQIVYLGFNISWLGGDSFYIFNIADAALTIGVIIFAIYFIFLYKPEMIEICGPMPQREEDDEDIESEDIEDDGDYEEYSSIEVETTAKLEENVVTATELDTKEDI